MPKAKKSKSRTARLSQTLRIQLSLPTLPSALTTTKPSAKKISGPDRFSLVVEQRADNFEQGLVFWTVGTVPEEGTDGHVGCLSTRAGVKLMSDHRQIGSRVAR